MRWWIELRKNYMAQVALVFILVIIFMALMAPVFGFDERADAGDLELRNLPPFWYANGVWKHPLGCDVQGRDVLSRVIYGSRTSLFIAILAVSISTFIGMAVGLIAGYYGGKIDDVIIGL